MIIRSEAGKCPKTGKPVTTRCFNCFHCRVISVVDEEKKHRFVINCTYKNRQKEKGSL